MKPGIGIVVALALSLTACSDATVAPSGPLTLRERLLRPPARMVADPSLPDPLAGIGTGGFGLSEEKLGPKFEGLLKVSLAKNRNHGECDVLQAVLLRGERRLEIPSVAIKSGDVLSYYTGTFNRRRKRSPLRPKPEVVIRLVAEDGDSLEFRTPVDPRRPDSWRESRFELSPLAGKTVRLEASLAGFWQEDDDHAVLGDLAILGQASADARPNVVLIWLDKFRGDLLEQNGGPAGWLPNLNALAAESVNFTRARSGANHTRNGVLQTFFSTISVNAYAVSGEPVALPSISSVMADAGYYSVSLGTNTYTTMFLPEWGVEQIDARHDRSRVDLRAHVSPEGRPYDDVYLLETQVEPWLRKERRGPFFLNVHYQGGHEPFENLRPEFVEEHRPEAMNLARNDGFEALYYLKVKLADEAVGRTVGLLKELGLWENSIVVVLADHGTNLGPQHRYFQRGYHRLVRACQPTAMYDEQVHVPLIVHAPGLPPARRDEPVTLLDLAPTLLDLVGLPIPPQFEGRSMSPALKGGPMAPEPHFFSCEAEALYGVFDGRYKYTYFSTPVWRHAVSEEWTPEGHEYVLPTGPDESIDRYLAPLQEKGILGERYQVQRELYDLQNDPGETENLAEREPEIVARLHALLTRRMFMDDPGSKIDLARVGLAFASQQRAEHRFTIASDGPLKLERATGACERGELRRLDANSIEVRCTIGPGQWGGVELYRAESQAIRIHAEREGDSRPYQEAVFGGSFGLPLFSSFVEGNLTLPPDALPAPARMRPKIEAKDEGLFVYRSTDGRPGAGELTAGLEKVFAEWGYAK